MAEKAIVGIATALFDGTVGGPGVAALTPVFIVESPISKIGSQQCNLSFGIVGVEHLPGSPHHHRLFGAAGSLLLGSRNVFTL